jgi:hypothetical protein
VAGRLSEGLFERVVTSALAEDLRGLEPGQSATTEPLAPADSHVALARHLAAEVQRVVDSVRGEDKPGAQVALVNRLLEVLQAEERVEAPGTELRSIHHAAAYERPHTPLATSTLLTRNRAEPNLGSELAREVASADRIDVLIAFITVGGVRLLRDALERFAQRASASRPLSLRVLAADVYAARVGAVTVPFPESVQSQFSAPRTTPAARTARIGRVVVQSCSANTAELERERGREARSARRGDGGSGRRWRGR